MQASTSKQFIIFFIVFWLGFEAVVVALSFVLPKELYLASYLTDTAREKTTQFLAEKAATLPDETLGWRNTPNLSRKQWVIDEWGGRHHSSVQLQKQPQTRRVLLLGSSLMNGSNAVDNQGTISALLDQQYAQFNTEQAMPQLEVLNFATMMYTLDQIYLQVKRDLLKFQPDILVIGLHEDPDAGLGNMYVPFRLLDEENMPFMKPRFLLLPPDQNTPQGRLGYLPPPLDHLAAQDNAMLDFLKTHDDYYGYFARFQHFHLTPITDAISKAGMKAKNLMSYWYENETKFNLLRTIMMELETLAFTENIQVIYLHLPTTRAVAPGGLWKYMPDYYQESHEWMSAPWSEKMRTTYPLVQTKGPTVLNIREHLRASPTSWQSLYAGDDLHFSQTGNSEIATAILQHLLQSKALMQTPLSNPLKNEYSQALED